MNNMFDDGLDEYVQQGNTPSEHVPSTAPQPKSAELAEIEKSLEVLKGIKEVQNEMRNTMSELKDMAKTAGSLSNKLTDDISRAKPIWDQLLERFHTTITVSNESLSAFDELMYQHANTVTKKSCQKIENTVTEMLTGKVSDVAEKHISDFDARMKAIDSQHEKALSRLQEEYNSSIKALKDDQEKLMAQAVAEQNRIIVPGSSFWMLGGILVFIIICGFISWLKFSHTPGYDETVSWMIAAGAVEIIYYINLTISHFSDKEDNKSKITGMFSVSLAQALYIVSLALTAAVYIAWAQMDVSSSAGMLIYMLPVVFASNFIWLLIRFVASGIFRK